MKKYVITGATSFIGKELVGYLLSSSNAEIYAVCRSGRGEWEDRRVNVIEADLSEYADLYTQIDNADIFINLAWDGTGHLGRNIHDVQMDNVANTLAAMSSAHKMGCRLFVEAGSQAEYGTVLSEINENTPCNPFSEYGKAKLEVKEKAFRFSEETGMKYLHLRIFSIYGENDHPWTLIISSIDKMLNNERVPLSSCTQKWNFLYVKDAAVQIVKLCDYVMSNEEVLHEVFNIASDDTRTLRNFIERIKILTKSVSVLDYGAVTPSNVVSLQPDITKLFSAIGFVSAYDFDDVITSIIKVRTCKNRIKDRKSWI